MGQGHISIDNLTFSYHQKSKLIVGKAEENLPQFNGVTVLHNISLEVKPGEFVAIVGPSGSGKSTLFRLLLGFEQPQTGSIFYDGKNLAELDLEAVRQQLGLYSIGESKILLSLFHKGTIPITSIIAH